MEPKDIICQFVSNNKCFYFENNVVLEQYFSSEKWIQYGTPLMKKMFNMDIHYEIKTYHSRIKICLHDERYRSDLLNKKLYEIAQWHGLMDGNDIVFYCPGKIHDYSEIDAITLITQGMHELFHAFEPFFNHVCSGLDHNTQCVDDLICSYQVEKALLSPAEMIRRIVNTDCSLTLSDGAVMCPCNRKEQNGWVGWRIYEDDFSDGDIHFEIRVDETGISVEFHDERQKPDALFRAIYREAVKNNLQADVNGIGLWISYKIRIQCNRSFNEIKTDMAKQMGVLWKIFIPLLDRAPVMETDTKAMPPLAKLPNREYDSNIKFRKDIDCDTLCWVISVESLMNRDPISLSSSNFENILMRPGQYVIPTYQRRYAWTKDNVYQLCRDLLHAFHRKQNNYHLGTLIFHAPQQGNDENSFFVVDGQQRLRTISRLLSQQIFTEINEPLPEKQFTDENEKNIWFALQRFHDDRDKILSMLRKSTFVCIAVNDITESFQLFSTQNGRGKTLSPENLLKAYHFHEIDKAENELKPDDLDRMDKTWESLNQKKTGTDGLLLHQVIGEHLYRIRCWLRGDFSPEPFSLQKVNAFKGLTIGSEAETPPLGNLSLLRRNGNPSHPQLMHRTGSDNDKMNPFVFIDQPIVNGSDFFEYVQTYCHAYEALFGNEPSPADLILFREFYRTNCRYPHSGRRGDIYARHIFQSLCLYCYDRFGAKGLNENYEYLYCCAYFERAVKIRCYYQTCGERYAIRAIREMSSASNYSDLKDALCELYLKVCEAFDKEGAAHVNGLECVHAIFSKEN